MSTSKESTRMPWGKLTQWCKTISLSKVKIMLWVDSSTIWDPSYRLPKELGLERSRKWEGKSTANGNLFLRGKLDKSQAGSKSRETTLKPKLGDSDRLWKEKADSPMTSGRSSTLWMWESKSSRSRQATKVNSRGGFQSLTAGCIQSPKRSKDLIAHFKPRMLRTTNWSINWEAMTLNQANSDCRLRKSQGGLPSLLRRKKSCLERIKISREGWEMPRSNKDRFSNIKTRSQCWAKKSKG